MTRDELVKQVLQGIMVLVGECRGSHAEMAGYMDKKSGEAIRHVRAIHLVECVWYDRVDRVLLMQYFGENITRVEQAIETFRYERGQLTGRLAGWDPEPLEIAELAARRAAALLTLFNWRQFHNSYDKEQSRFPVCVTDAWKTAASFVDFYFSRVTGRKGNAKALEPPADLVASRVAEFAGLAGTRAPLRAWVTCSSCDKSVHPR